MKKLFLHGAILLAAFSPAAAAPKMDIASFSTVLTEIAQRVGGEHVVVYGLVRPGIDPHEYEPTPADLQEVSGARLILTNGRHLENYLNKLQAASGGRADLLKVGDALSGLTADPHWWNSVLYVEQATRIVREKLCALDPADAADFARNAQSYLTSLEDLERWARRKVAELPRDRRKLVTSHEAFEYFSREFGFTLSAIEGVNSESEPSNRHVAELIDRIKKQNIKAIFVESTLNPKVTAEITRETGAKIGGTLYADGLGPGEAGSYAGMFRHNVSTIVDALK
jgi:zinc/manganese transport system substrate-binding protein